MLDLMRRNANSWIMVLLFGIIIFVFAINFGPWAGQISPTATYSVLVNNEAISLAEFRTAYASQFARIKQFRPDYDQTQADNDGLKQMVLEQLVSRELLTQQGRHNNLSIAPLTLALEIKERVFGDEEFKKDAYVSRVNSFFQSSVAQFEAQVEKELIAEQMANILGTAVYISDSEALLSYKDKNTKVALEFVKVNPTYFTAESPSADAVNQFVSTQNKEIADYYNEHLSDYVKDPEIRASHILVKAAKDAPAESKKALKEKAQKLLERVKNNEDFATLAKSDSDDTGTKEKGGDLGTFTAGMMVEEFSKAAFALKPGEVSDVVESPFGYHIIKQTEQKPRIERNLEDAQTEIAGILIKKKEQDRKAKALASSALQQLQNGTPIKSISLASIGNLSAKEKPSSSEPASAPVADETEPFNRASGYIYKIGRAEKISDAAFKLTMENRVAPEVIEANGEFYAIRLKSREDADLAKYEEQKESIKSTLMYPRRRAFMQQYLSHLKASAKITYNEILMKTKDAG